VELRGYQEKLAEKAFQIISTLHIVYLAIEMRVGKTLIALRTADLLKVEKVLFVTKKKAIGSIISDYEKSGFEFHLEVINYEQLHKIEDIYDVVIADEAHCFLGNTIVDEKRIDTIQEGDYVNSYNHVKNIIERKKVIKIYKNRIKDTLLCLSLGNTPIVCTKNHKFFVKGKGYIAAENLKIGDYFYENNKLQNLSKRNNNRQSSLQNQQQSREKGNGMLFKKMFIEVAARGIFDTKTCNNRIELHGMRENNIRLREELPQKITGKYADLFSGMFTKAKKPKSQKWNDRRNEKNKFGKDDQKQSNVQIRNKGENVANIKENRAQTTNQRWQWSYSKICGTVIGKIRGGIYHGVSGTYSKRNKRKVQNSNMLQSRFRKYTKENSHRSGWSQSSINISQRKRQEKNNSIGIVRLDGITNYEPTGGEQFVYNLEVEKNNNYFANNILVHNCCGAYPKPSARTKELKRIISAGNSKLILCSGTPSPETYSQLFHQFWISPKNPFNQESFYKWAHEFVNIQEKTFNGMRFRDYKDAHKDKIMGVLNKYFIRYSQVDANFKQSDVEEEIICIPRSQNVEKMVKILMKDRYYRFNDGQEIIADTAVKLQAKIHQAYSGTIKTEEGLTKIIDISKAKYILESYHGYKIAIFYKFKAEGDVLKKIVPNWTDDPQKFNSESESVFICQILSGSMGVNLSSADILIFYNIDFSSTQYWQARARIQTFDRDKAAIVHWLFMENGIERKVYDAVLKKKDYTLSYFRKDYACN